MFEATCLTCGGMSIYPLAEAGRKVHCKSCVSGWIILPPANGPRYTTLATAGLFTEQLPGMPNPQPSAVKPPPPTPPAQVETVAPNLPMPNLEPAEKAPPKAAESLEKAAARIRKEAAPPPPKKQNKLRAWGVVLLFFGLGSFVLSQLDMQFRVMEIFGDAQEIAAFGMAIAGAIMVAASYGMAE